MEAAGKQWILHGSRTDAIKLWGLADFHLGNRATEKDRLWRDIQAIKDDPYSFWVGVGDYGDYISPRDRRFDAEAIDPEILGVGDLKSVGRAVAASVAKWMEPIKDKCLGLAFGNHEDKYMNEQEQGDLHAWLCTEMGVRNLRYSALFDVVFIRSGAKSPRLVTSPPVKNKGTSFTVRFYVHHGAGGAVTKSGKANRLERFMQMTTADVVFAAHCHDGMILPCPILDLDASGNRLREKQRFAVMTGSYLRTYAQGMTTYGEKRGYAPSTLGATGVTIWPSQMAISPRMGISPECETGATSPSRSIRRKGSAE